MMTGTLSDTRAALMALLEENVAALREARDHCLRISQTASDEATEKTARTHFLAVVECLRKHTETALRLKEDVNIQEEFKRFKQATIDVLRTVDPEVARRVLEIMDERSAARNQATARQPAAWKEAEEDEE
jgi:hypothetical protein